MHYILEILRSTHAENPFAFQLGVSEYVFRSQLGGAQTATLDWDAPLLAELEALRQPRRDPALVQRLGERLSQFLAPTHALTQLSEVAAASLRGEPVTVTLRLAAAELYALPWELVALPGSGRHLGAIPGVLLRYAWPDTATAREEPAPRREGGRILFCWSAAGGAVPAAEHLAAIEGACAARSGEHPFSRDLDVLPHVSCARLAEELARAPAAVLHILCHGASIGSTFGLAWDSGPASESRHLVDAAALRELIGRHAATLRLVVLTACDSGNSGQLGNHLGSIAQALHRAGIAAVVASRHPLSVDGSIQLTAALYGSLLGVPASLEAAFLSARQALENLPGKLDWAALQLYARPEDGDDSRPIIIRPYRGLEPFLLRHHRFFFGRERERLAARAALQTLAQEGKPRLLIVAGASGTGKSSVVLGGLVPDLTLGDERGERLSEARRALDHFRGTLGANAHHPSIDPALKTLTSAVAALSAGGTGPWEWALVRPGHSPLGALHAALRSRQDPARPFLLCVDQFEELFTHTTDPSQRSEFAARLWALCQQPSGIACVVTLRVDFLGHCGELTLDETGLRLDRIAYDDAHRLFVAQLEPAQLMSAIREPARLVGLKLPRSLAERMIAEVDGEPGALPLLSYVLDLLWQRRAGGALAEASYSELGGVGGALGNSAERLWDSLPADEQRLARQLLVRLVGFSDGIGQETRRRVALAALREQIADPGQRLDKVLAAFVDARLLVRSEQGGQTLLEVAHEALIRKWDRLQQFLREDRERLTELRELEQWAESYVNYRTLLRGPQLGYAQRLLQKYPDDLGPVLTRMVRDSVSARRWTRIRQLTAIALALTTLTALSIWARQSQQRAVAENRIATQKARIALSRLLGVQADRALESQPDAALLLSTRAVQLQDEHQSRSMLFAALERTRAVRAFLRAPPGPLHSLAFSPRGDRLAAAGAEPALWLYDTASGALLDRLASSKSDGEPPVMIYAAAWSADGRLLAGGGSKGRLWLWHPERPAEPAELIKTPARSIYSLDFSRDGKLLAAGDEEGHVLLYDLASRALREPLRSSHAQLISALSFREGSGGEPRLALGTADGTIEVLAPLTGARLLGPLLLKEGSVSSIAWSPDGRLLAAGTEDRAVLLWDAETGQPSGPPLSIHRGAVSGIGFGPGGRLLASCGLDRTIYFWDVASRRTVGKPLLMREAVDSCAVSSDGRLLASGGATELVLWDLSEHPARHRQSYRIAVSALAIEPRGKHAVIGGPDGSLRTWNLTAGQPEPAVHDGVAAGGINALSYSPDGKLLATAGADGAVRLRQAGTLELVQTLPGARPSAALSVATSPRGDTVAAGFADGTLLLWQLPSGQLRTPAIATRQQAVTALGFTRSGEALVTGGLDGSLTWRDPRSGAPICPSLRAHRDAISGLGFGPAGLFATGSRDQTVALWTDRCPSQPVERLTAHAAAVAAVGYSLDGQTLVSADEDANVIIWDAALRQPLGKWLAGHERPISALAMGPDGLLLTGDEETVWRWDLYKARWPARACRRANRNLSLHEWRQYLGDSPYCRICAALPSGAGAPAGASACGEGADTAPSY